MIAFIGLLGGFVSGFFGTGGGLIILPALIRIMKIDSMKARGVTLASILIAVLVATIFYGKMKYIDMKVSLQVALGGVIGGILGALLVKRISKTVLSVLFDVFLLYAGVRMIFGS